MEKIALCRVLDAEKLLEQARVVQQALQQVMRSFGRACRGQGRIFVKLVRQTEQQLLEFGQDVSSLGLYAKRCLQTDAWPESGKEQLERKLQDALEAHRHIEKQSRLLIHGKKPARIKIVNAYDPTIAPIKKGKSNCPCQFGKKVGVMAEMATGFIFGFYLPEGNPDDASYVLPLIERVKKAFDPQALQEKPPCAFEPTIRSITGDLGIHDAKLRERLHSLGILTVGIPKGIEPVEKTPNPEMIQAVLDDPAIKGTFTAQQVELAYACGYSRPFVESIIYDLSCRGGAQIKYKGHRGAHIQIGMAIMAHNAATLVRIRQNRLSERAQHSRQLLKLVPPNLLEDNVLIN